MAVAWEKNPRLPRGVAAVLAALRFSAPAPELLRQLSDVEWKSTLDFADRSSLTLFLGALYRDYLPAWVAERIDRNIAGNTERIGRLRAALVEIAAAFDARNIDYLLLKGFSHETDYAPDPYLRVGYDLDLFAPESSLRHAHETLRGMDYVPVEGTEDALADHYPPLIRKTGWAFHGDFFDPDIPGCVDLHYRFWDPETERFDAPGVDQFWERRITQDAIPVLHAADRLAYASLHMLRHLFRPALRPLHVYELAYFLETKSADDAFWNRWHEMHPERLRRLQAVAFRLAESWFGCRIGPAPAEEIERLHPDVRLWFERYAASPIEAASRPNKHELWLHLALLDSSRDRRHVFLRRVFPASLPGPVEPQHVPDDQVTFSMRVRRGIRYVTYTAHRFLHHARSLLPLVAHGLFWKSPIWRLQAPFWRFLVCSTCVNFGAYLFLLLYNLYLLDLGYRENVLGLIASAFTAGNLVGVLPAAGLAHRVGLKRTLLVCIAGSAIVYLLRAVLTGEPALLATAFAGGLMFSFWAVCMSPVVAAVTSESARPSGFSVTFGSGIALGVLAGLVGGRMPGWVARAGWASSPAQAKRLVLFAACASVLLALWPALRLRLESQAPRDARSYPGGPFIRRFLLAIGVWGFAIGLFNPFFNAYFARQFRMSVEKIGTTFSIAQAIEVAAMMAAPFVLRRLGLTRGVAVMQFAAAIALALLAPAHVALVAATLYAAFASFQYMSEPGIYSSLMSRVLPEQRSGASAMNFLVMFAGQALAATVGGAVVARYGYPPMLGAASALAAVAAWLFWRLPQESR
jgi:MFS family permease